MAKILILNGSPRKNGKTASLVKAFVEGAEASGNEVKNLYLQDMNIGGFRIYRVVPELDKITVYARHIFYDLLDNMIHSYKPSSAAVGASVVQTISSSCLSDHDFTFYSDLDSRAEDVAFENVNPVDALLGEGGVVEKYVGELTRDWWDVYVVQRVGLDSNVQIRQAKNLLGVSYDVDLTDVVTRIMPTGEDADGNVLYLPELFLDSPLIASYPHPKWIHLAVSEAKEVTSGDDQKTKAECYTAMREAAQAQFDAGCDMPTITLTVSFINCADTEEYQEYGFLQNIYLGDAVRVIAPRIGVWVSMRMTQYTYEGVHPDAGWRGAHHRPACGRYRQRAERSGHLLLYVERRPQPARECGARWPAYPGQAEGHPVPAARQRSQRRTDRPGRRRMTAALIS